MSTVVMELYTALRSAGVSEEQARAAAAAVIGIDDTSTRSDLIVTKADLSELKAELIKWNVVTIIILAAIFAATIIKL